MTKRIPELQAALHSLQTGLRAVVPQTSPAAEILKKAFIALSVIKVPEEPTSPKHQPATNLLQPALALAYRGPTHSANFSKDLAVLLPLLHWIKAENMAPGNEMANEYAEAYLVGPNGIEVRRDVQVGISILDKNIVYPGHRHPPEEVYLALTGGMWKQNGDEWKDHKAGDFIYNPSGTLHSMSSKPYPQLSVWVLLNR